MDLSLPTVVYVIIGLVLKLVWFEVDDDKYGFTFLWGVAGSVVGPLAPLGCLLLGPDCQCRGVRIPYSPYGILTLNTQKTLAKVLISFCSFCL